MSDLNLAVGFAHLWARQSGGGATAMNSSEDKWTIGNSTSVEDQYRWIYIVDETIITLTVVGAAAILITMFVLEYRGRPATTRIRLVQSLVLSDLILGIVGMIGTSMTLAGVNLADHPAQCDGLGFSLVAVLWTEHMWTLALAIATYMILIYPLNQFTLWLERKWYWLWGLVWVTAIIVALIGYLVYGYFDVGGLCYYGGNTGLYGELMQFIPRTIVFVSITILYARLYVFLRRPDRIRASFSDTGNSDLYGDTRRSSILGRPARALSALWKRSTSSRKGSRSTAPDEKRNAPLNEKSTRISLPPIPPVDQMAVHDQLSPMSMGPDSAPIPPARSSSGGPEAIPPWEQIQLPIFHVDGERFGGSSGGPRERSAGGSGSRDQGMWSGWKGLGGGSRRHRPSSAGNSGGSSPPAIHVPRFSASTGTVPTPKTSPTPAFAARMGSLDSAMVEERTPTQSQVSAIRNQESDRKPSAVSFQLSELTPIQSHSSDSDGPSSGRTRVEDREEKGIKDDGDMDGDQATIRKGSMPMTIVSDFDVEDGRERDQRARYGDEEDEEESDGEMDLMRMLQRSAPPGDGRANQEASYEFVEESMASYLNRKTALLMLWFPLGYVLLFSVSLIRIIYDFADRPPIVLRAISRWFVFAQGLLDALIYGLVEWHTKRVVRKRVRKGTFNTPAGSGGSAGGSRPLANLRLFSRASGSIPGFGGKNAPGSDEDPGSAGQRTPRGSQTRSQLGNAFGMSRINKRSNSSATNPTNSVAYGDRSIIQDLGIDPKQHEDGRRGSGSGSGTGSGSASGSGSGSSIRKGSDISGLEAVYEVSHTPLSPVESESQKEGNGGVNRG